MKVLVIDQSQRIAACLANAEAEVLLFVDEIKALNAAEAVQPELILVDYALLGDETPDFIRMLLDVSESSKLVVIGDQLAEEDVLRCLLIGAQGYQGYQRLPDCIEKMIRVVINGEAWVSRKMVTRVLQEIRLLNMQTLS